MAKKTTEVVFEKGKLIELEKSGSSHKPYEKTSQNFLEAAAYDIPKYSIYQSGVISCLARRQTTLTGSSSLALSIGGTVCANFDSVTNSSTLQLYSGNLTESCIVNSENYLTISGNAKWNGQSGLSFYIQNPTIALTYNCPKYTLNLQTDATKGTVTCANGSSSMEFDVTTKGQTQQTTITATPKEGYFFMGWSDGNEEPSRTIVLREADLTSNNTQITYTAIFGKKEMYVGTKPVSAVYVGTKKAKVYRGTTRIL